MFVCPPPSRLFKFINNRSVYGGTKSRIILEQHVVRTPFVLKISFKPTGIPASDNDSPRKPFINSGCFKRTLPSGLRTHSVGIEFGDASVDFAGQFCGRKFLLRSPSAASASVSEASI
jgi:hypothetical protein